MQAADQSNPMSEDARMIAAASAARTERQNQPRHLIILALVMLVIAAATLLNAMNASAAADRSLAFQKTKASRVASKLGELEALRQRQSSAESSTKLNESSSQIMAKITGAGATVGIKEPVRPPSITTPKANDQGSRQLKLPFTVSDESLPTLLAWVDRCLAEVSGLEVYSISVAPEPPQNPTRWKLSVTFSRWEKVDKGEGA